MVLAMAGAASLAACASGSRVEIAAAQEAALGSLLDGAALQAQRCYRAPRVGYTGRQIVTRVRVALAQDGTIEGRPLVIFQDGITETSRSYAERMAQAAIDAVLRCAPYRVPGGLATGGRRIEFDLTFSPRALA